MEDELKLYQSESLVRCNKLLRDLKKNRDDADRIFHGELYKAYTETTDKAIEHALKIKNNIRRL